MSTFSLAAGVSCFWLLLCSTALVRAADPEGLLVFVSAFAPGDEGGVHAYSLNPESGVLTPVHRTGGVEHPFFLALSPDRKFLYSIHAPGEFGGTNPEFVASFALDGRSGRMTPLNRQSAKGTAACFLEVDATGKTVLLANYTTGSVAAFPLRPDGSLGEAASFVQHRGSSVNPDRQKEAHAHCFVISPDNRFAYAADLGLDQVLAYALDPASATLTPAVQPFVRTPPGAGPRHLIFHPQQPWMYVINELSNSVTRFDHHPEQGMLIERQTISTLPADFTGTSYCADLKITPDGKFLYGTNRGHDSIAGYRIGEDGTLSLLQITPSLGKGPQNLAITPDGRWLMCANMPGNSVVVFRIDSRTGSLNATGDPVTVPMPSCIRIF